MSYWVYIAYCSVKHSHMGKPSADLSQSLTAPDASAPVRRMSRSRTASVGAAVGRRMQSTSTDAEQEVKVVDAQPLEAAAAEKNAEVAKEPSKTEHHDSIGLSAKERLVMR